MHYSRATAVAAASLGLYAQSTLSVQIEYRVYSMIGGGWFPLEVSPNTCTDFPYHTSDIDGIRSALPFTIWREKGCTGEPQDFEAGEHFPGLYPESIAVYDE
ncbi:hypothetical protein BJY01DRAFT_247370 [Aspergillus pseudoustus]|uniref:Uncharacterized protein n=1 Tax=Aspergillus pseudoustus TaxID=1810923 RepID=A0ABR4K1K9_9EURO